MARHKFPGDLHLQADGTPAGNASFTFWSDAQSGTQYTDILAQDGVTPATLVTDVSGNRPYLYGPDNVEVMYVDTGVSIRYPVVCIDQTAVVLDESFLSGILSRLSVLEGGGGGGSGGTGVSDHGLLAGLADDDHPHYLNVTRGDARYATPTQVTTAVTSQLTTNSSGDRNRANHYGTQDPTSVDGLPAALEAMANSVSQEELNVAVATAVAEAAGGNSVIYGGSAASTA